MFTLLLFSFPSSMSGVIFLLPENVSFSKGLLVTHSCVLGGFVCLSENVFIPPSFLRDIIAGYRISSWNFPSAL